MSDLNLFNRLFSLERASRVAIVFERREITYEDLREETVRTAEALKALGVEPDDRVCILLNDSPEFITAFVAVISLGAIAVPINMALPSREWLLILNDCGARTAVIEAQAALTLFENSTDPALMTTLQDLLVVCREGEISPSLAGVNLVTLETAERQGLSDAFPVSDREEKSAFILYTSGSTGEPKGAIHRQADMFFTNETFCSEVLRLRDGDRLFSSSRLPFAYGLGNSFTFPLLNGYTTILCREKPAPEVVARVFHEDQPTIFFGVPLVYRMLLEHHRNSAALDTSSLRLCVSAGEALPAQLGKQWEETFGVEVLDGIGSTEMLHMFMSNHQGAVKYGSSGTLLEGYQARLIDHEGTATPAGEVGNLWIRGNSASAGYWQRPKITTQTFVDGWVRTGDLYRCDGDGFWWHMGRSDDCFKPTGQWVSPIEVESVLLRSNAIRAAAVVEGFDDIGLSCVCAFIVNQNNESENAEIEKELRMICERELPRFKQPRRYLFISELPYTATGKVQRFKLREQLRSK
jgi:benzoate-CoA ligase family protein